MSQQNFIGNLKILNSRDVKHILERLSEQYGADYSKEFSKFAFLMNKDNRIYLVSRNVEILPYDEIRIDTLGTYFGELYKESVRLTIEGSQIVGPFAKLNVVTLNYDQMVDWIKGADLPYDAEAGKEFLIIQHVDEKTGSTDYLGCGKFKDGKILNMVSKSRRLVVVNN